MIKPKVNSKELEKNSWAFKMDPISTRLDASDNLTEIHRAMDIGNYFDAKVKLLNLLTLLSDNDVQIVEAQADLSGCMYLTGDVIQFENYIRKSLANLKRLSGKMTNYQHLTCRLKLGRLFAELGHISISFSLYDTDMIPENQNEQNRLTEILCEMLLLSRSYLDAETVAKNYYRLESMSSIAPKLTDVVQHSLILADMKLFGYEAAYKRWNQLMQKQLLLNEEHQQWLYFDFVFGALQLNLSHQIPSDFLSRFNYYNLSSFEQVVWDIFQVSRKQQPEKDLSAHRTQGMSLLCGFRILHLMESYVFSDQDKLEIFKKKVFLLKNVDTKSRTLFRQRFFNGKLNFTGQFEQFTNLEKKFLNLLIKQPSQKISDVSNQIYQEDISDHVMNRIRVNISKINQKLSQFGEGKLRLANQMLIAEGDFTWMKESEDEAV